MNSTITSSAIATSSSNCKSEALFRQVVGIKRSSKPNRTSVLVDLELLKFLGLGVHCKVQLVSEELELDACEMPVPKDYPIIELIVLDDSRATIEQMIASIPEYQGYKVFDYWQVIDNQNLF